MGHWLAGQSLPSHCQYSLATLISVATAHLLHTISKKCQPYSVAPW